MDIEVQTPVPFRILYIVFKRFGILSVAEVSPVIETGIRGVVMAGRVKVSHGPVRIEVLRPLATP